jgi:hypothetical protein
VKVGKEWFGGVWRAWGKEKTLCGEGFSQE